MSTPINEISTQALAYLGDCVLELCVREFLVLNGFSSSRRLNEKALEFVRASEQASAMEKILPMLSEKEAMAFRRGRNIGHTSTPKSATVAQYRSATGMEALFAYLHLAGSAERIKELFSLAYAEKLAELSNEAQKGN